MTTYIFWKYLHLIYAFNWYHFLTEIMKRMKIQMDEIKPKHKLFYLENFSVSWQTGNSDLGEPSRAWKRSDFGRPLVLLCSLLLGLPFTISRSICTFLLNCKYLAKLFQISISLYRFGHNLFMKINFATSFHKNWGTLQTFTNFYCLNFDHQRELISILKYIIIFIS